VINNSDNSLLTSLADRHLQTTACMWHQTLFYGHLTDGHIKCWPMSGRPRRQLKIQADPNIFFCFSKIVC